MYNQVEDELKHFGVLGMKWGVRKADSGGKANSKPKRERKPPSKVKRIGKSLVAAMLVGNVGQLAVYGITKNPAAAKKTLDVLGVIGGLSYYQYSGKK